jgi:hypothetical protein
MNAIGSRATTDRGFLEAQDPGGAVRFYEMLARWREQGDLEGLTIYPALAAPTALYCSMNSSSIAGTRRRVGINSSPILRSIISCR